MLNVDHRAICRFPDMYFPGYLQVLDCLDDIWTSLVARRTETQQKARDGGSAGGNTPAGFRGGNAVGGDATSNTPGGRAEGGSATGGHVEISSTRCWVGVPLAGGHGTGGSATGDYAVGGSGVGGTVRLG
jgi:hypothetical protein